MKRFDARQFLLDYRIPYEEEGQNSSRNYVNVDCPFCNDHKKHLGISKSRGTVHCWKCGFHPLPETIKLLTGETKIKNILEKYSTITSTIEDKYLADYVIPKREIEIPGTKNFKKVHKRYLEKRGFDPDYLIKKYDLRVTGSTAGSYSHRIIFPIYFKGRIVSYQGRTYADAKPKYMTCKPDNELIFHKDIFFNLDNAKSDRVIVVEGVTDAIRMGSNTIASFGTSITSSQLLLLRQYRKVYLLYDSEPEAQEKAQKALYKLNSFGIETENLLLDEGDPGDMLDSDVFELKAELNIL